MTDHTTDRGTANSMIANLVVVFMGFWVLVLVLVSIGYFGDKYYSAGKLAKELDLLKQEAFAKGMNPRDFLRAELNGKKIEPQMYDYLIAILDAEGSAEGATDDQGRAEMTIPVALLPIAAEKLLPPPDLTITEEDLDRMRGKAALIHTTLGTIVVELFPEHAPRICKNFIYLVESGFYDGLFFHRNLPALYIETGSPSGMRGGNAGYTFPKEFNSLPPLVGTIVALSPPMGNPEKPVFASEFAILVGDGKEFASEVTVFGRVIDRINVAEKIADTYFDNNRYSFERTYVRTVRIVETASVRPQEDIWN